MDIDLDRYVMTRPRLITGVETAVDESEVLRYLGYPHDCSPPLSVMTLIDHWITEASRIAAPRASYVVSPVVEQAATRIVVLAPSDSRTENDWSEPGRVEFHGAFDRFLGVSQCIIAFIATAGPEIDRLASRLIDGGEALPALVVNAVGSERAQAAASAVRNQVRTQTITDGLTPTLPYSPGHCGMLLKEQKRLFELFDGQAAGVTLSATCQMLPIKSISGFFGLAPPEAVENAESPCERCGLESCSMRRTSTLK